MAASTIPSGERIKARIRATWDQGAAGYDEQYGHGLKSAAERDARLRLLRRLLPPEQPRRVLDIGSGTGFLALLLAELGHDVTGVDISEGMLAVARQKAREAGLTIDFQVGNADAVGFPDASFDVVISRHLIWTLLEPERAVRQWARVARPGGQVIAIDGLWQSSRLWDRAASLAGAGLKRLVKRGERREHAYPEETRGRLPLMGLLTTEPARNVFLRAGLTKVRTEELAWLDAEERAAMPLTERLTNHYRRYLIEGEVRSSAARGDA